jgi:hypothetical protein
VRRFLLLLVSVAVFTAVFASSASAAGAWGSDGCGNSEKQPRVIAFSCADGKVVFQPDEWIRWRMNEAVASGLLRHPDRTDPTCAGRPLSSCPWVASKATVRFSESSYCPSNGRWQFMRLQLDAPEDSDPSLRSIERRLKCSEYERLEPVEPPPVRYQSCGSSRGSFYIGPGLPRLQAEVRRIVARGVACGRARRFAHRLFFRQECIYCDAPNSYDYGDRVRFRGFKCLVTRGEPHTFHCRRGDKRINFKTATLYSE